MAKRSNKRKNKRKEKINIDQKEEELPIDNEKIENKIYTVEKLLLKAEELIDSFEFTAASKFCEKALQQEPNNVKCIETMGLMFMEGAQLDEAKTQFRKAIELETDEGHSKYMNIGQLCTGLEAINYFMKGLDIMTHIFKREQVNEKKPVTARDISSAHCSIAEIYLTDACYEDDAQTQCCDHLLMAIKTDCTNPDAFHLSASFYLTIGEIEKSIEHIEKGVALWLPEMISGSNTGGASSSDHIYVCSQSYVSRINATKILIELELIDKAVEILELLLDEEDEVLDVWYLLGLIHDMKDDKESKDASRYYLDKALDLIKKVGSQDQNMVEHITEIREKLGDALESDTEVTSNDEISSSDEDMEQD